MFDRWLRRRARRRRDTVRRAAVMIAAHELAHGIVNGVSVQDPDRGGRWDQGHTDGVATWPEWVRAFVQNTIDLRRLWPGEEAPQFRRSSNPATGQVAALTSILAAAGFTDRDAALAARLLQAWCWGEVLGWDAPHDGPHPVQLLDPLAPSGGRLQIGDEEIAAFVLDVMIDGLSARRARTAAPDVGADDPDASLR